MKVRIEQVPLDEDWEVPEGYELVATHATGDYAHGGGLFAVLQVVEPTPAMAQLVEAAASVPSGQAIGMPAELLREALAELGYNVPEPSPIVVPSTDAVAGIEQPGHYL